MDNLVNGIIIVLFLLTLSISQVSWAIPYDKIESGLISPNTIFQHTFTNTGTFEYHCQLHPWLNGIIEVTGSDSPINVVIKIPKGSVETNSSVSFEPNHVTIASGSTVIWNNTDAFSHTVANIDTLPETSLEPIIIFSPLSPLKQFKTGIPINKIQCKEFLNLVTKYDGSPACVKPETKTKLIERGFVFDWLDAQPNEVNTWVSKYPIDCFGDLCYIDDIKSYYNSTNLQTEPQLGNLQGIGFNQTISFIKDHYQKQGIKIFDVQHVFVKGSSCEVGECWYKYRLDLQVSNSDLDDISRYNYTLRDILITKILTSAQ